MGMLRSPLLLLTSPPPVSSTIRRARDYEKRDYYVLELQSNDQVRYIEETLDLEHEEPLGELKYHHVFSRLKHDGDAVEDHRNHLRLVKRDYEAADYFDNA